MLARLMLLTCVVLGITVLLTGAWPGPIPEPMQDAETTFVAQPVPLDGDIVGSGVSAAELVRKALEKLDWKKTAWLRTKIRQSMNDPECTCVAEGTLYRGPNQCARLMMQTGPRRWLVVSDGEVAAHVLERDGGSPEVNLEQLPAHSENPAEREAFLAAKGCGGPAAVLHNLLPFLDNAKLQTGLLDNVPVIQVQFEAPAADSSTTNPARCGHLYLDAKTLWPWRIEWSGETGSHRRRSILRIEFLEPELNHERSTEECMRLFSYEPSK